MGTIYNIIYELITLNSIPTNAYTDRITVILCSD